MTKSETKLLIGIGILILLIDTFFMKYWISSIKPYPSMSVGVESYKLEIFGANILIGIIVFFIRKKLSILFLINTIVCYWIFSFFWNSWIENHPYSTSEYSFNVENRNFVLSIDKNPDFFGIDEIISESKDSLITIGMYEKAGDSIMLTSMQETMYFYNDQLIGFSQSPNEIDLNKPSDKILTKEMTKRKKFDTSKLTDKEKQILNEFYKRREIFDAFVNQEKIDRHTCPGCGYPTLSERGEYEICEVCNWEDDGLDEKQANEIWSGPNQGLTLTENRLNIGKTLNSIAESLNGKIDTNPKEVMKAFVEHNKRMNAFDEEKMMDALRDDPIWKEWDKQSKVILTDLIKK